MDWTAILRRICWKSYFEHQYWNMSSEKIGKNLCRTENNCFMAGQLNSLSSLRLDSGAISWRQRSSPSPPRYGFHQSVRHAKKKGNACASFLGNMIDGVRRHNGLAQIARVPCASFECGGNSSSYSESRPSRERALFFNVCISRLSVSMRRHSQGQNVGMALCYISAGSNSLKLNFTTSQYWVLEAIHKNVIPDKQIDLFGKILQTIEIPTSGVRTSGSLQPVAMTFRSKFFNPARFTSSAGSTPSGWLPASNMPGVFHA